MHIFREALLLPEILYKYREDSDYTEKIVTDRKIWLSTANGLNDPLECRTGKVPLAWKKQQIQEMENAQLLGFVGFPADLPKTLFSFPPEETKRFWKKFRKSGREGKIKLMRAVHEMHGVQLSKPENLFLNFERQLSRVGVFSLTERPDNELMWAHYSKSHTGLAFGFSRAEGNRLADPRQTIKVTYEAEKPIFKDGLLQQIAIGLDSDGTQVSHASISFDDPVFRAAFSTKPPAWGYEEEWRYVEESAGLHDWPGELISIIFGYRMPKDRRDHYRRLVEDSGNDVALYELKVNSKVQFELAKLSR